MEFQLFHKNFFNAIAGSYSIVTDREVYDSQITLTDFEAGLIINYFKRQNIHVGNVGSDKRKSQKQFLVYPNFNIVNLNLVFPKLNKTELRLYLSVRAGFKPPSGYIWFLYINSGGALVIGALPKIIWDSLDQEDAEDNTYIKQVEAAVAQVPLKRAPTPQISQRIIAAKKVYERNPLVAAYSLQKSNYSCDVDSQHKTFLAAKSNLQFVEAHHFIPMKFQDHFHFPLDCVENVVALCPTCHRGIHLGVVEHKRILVDSIFGKRGAIQKFSRDDIYSFYNLIGA